MNIETQLIEIHELLGRIFIRIDAIQKMLEDMEKIQSRECLICGTVHMNNGKYCSLCERNKE